MAKSFNKATLLGNLTRDPEIRNTTTGQKVASVSIAINRSWNDSGGEKREQTDFFDIVMWGKLADVAESYLKKGSKVLIEGRLQNRSWDANDGTKRTKTEIIASDLVMLDRASGFGGDDSFNSNANNSTNSGEGNTPSEDLAGLEEPINLDDAIPF